MQNRLVFSQTVFLLDRLILVRNPVTLRRLPNASQLFTTATLLPYVQPNAASFFRRVRTSRATHAVGQRTLVSEKKMLRSAGRRGLVVAPNVCDGLTKKGSLKMVFFTFRLP